MTLKNNIRFGFGASLGSLGAHALFGLMSLLGSVLVMSSTRRDGSRNKVKLGLGVTLLLISILPYLPLLGMMSLMSG